MFEERCYQKFPSPLVWWAAENYCQALGGHLAAVNTLEENDFLRDNIGNGWIGMKLVCDDCMARKTACGNIRCGIPDQYRCGLIYSPGYPTAFPSSVICLWTIEGAPGSFITLLLLDVDLPGYSGGACTSRVLQVRDRFLTVGWNTIHGLCRGEGEQKRYVSSSNEMQLAMLATSSNSDFGDSRGFMATFNVSTFSTSRQVQNLPDDAGNFYTLFLFYFT
ncbi:dorsal-ventral patterning tolloid-like protein 1 [Branchiostoma floridae]|uniref:Dorsal-ventral patterning tolloid-like protein 1 n=1 Tax=Branchiostoma floridae TaxID=7739 RepID=A0A9J7HMR2_BRAFL|nr:dorsal-ventral patterning tolloid-like protein 1 [Branchiostoma floridae]